MPSHFFFFYLAIFSPFHGNSDDENFFYISPLRVVLFLLQVVWKLLRHQRYIPLLERDPSSLICSSVPRLWGGFFFFFFPYHVSNHKNTHTHTITCIHKTHTQTHVNTHTCTHIYTHAYIYIQTHTQTQIHIYKHTHTHSCIKIRAK